MNYITNKEEYLKLSKAWKDHVNSGKTVTAMHHMIYNAIRGYDLKRGFTPITREARLNAGHDPNGSYNSAKAGIKYKWKQPWEGPFMFGLSEKEYEALCILIVS